MDWTSAVNQVRGYIPDVEKLPNMTDPDKEPAYLFTDEHLQMLLEVEKGSVKRAAAAACQILGTSELLISKVIKTEDLQTDGAKAMGQFLARARILRAEAQEDDIDEEAFFDVVPYIPYPPHQGPR